MFRPPRARVRGEESLTGNVHTLACLLGVVERGEEGCSSRKVSPWDELFYESKSKRRLYYTQRQLQQSTAEV